MLKHLSWNVFKNFIMVEPGRPIKLKRKQMLVI